MFLVFKYFEMGQVYAVEIVVFMFLLDAFLRVNFLSWFQLCFPLLYLYHRSIFDSFNFWRLVTFFTGLSIFYQFCVVLVRPCSA